MASAQEEGLANVMVNPGFERAFDEPSQGPRPFYWHPSPQWPAPGTEMRQDDDHHHNGSNSVKVHMEDVSDDQEAYWYQSQYVGGGVTAPFGGWVRTDLEEGSSVILRVIVRDEDRSILDTREVSLDGDWPVWRELRGEPFLLDDETYRVQMECVLLGPGTVWFDDVYVGIPTDMNNPPFVVSVPQLDAAVGVEYTYRARGVDLEGDVVSFGLQRGPDGMNVSEEGLVSWVPETLPEAAVKVVLRAIDDAGGVSYQDFFIQVHETPVQRPVHVYLYSTYDDPFNDDLSGERYDRLLPVLEDLWRDHPDLHPSVTVLLNGADVTDPTTGRLGALQSIEEGSESGWLEVGYTAFHEPTYYTNPIYDPGYDGWDWTERVTAVQALLSQPRDPLTGEELAIGQGGIQAVRTAMGNVTVVAGAGTDGAQLHALSRFDASSLHLGFDDGPSEIGTIVGDPSAGTVASMLSEDAAVPYGLYWQGGRLHLATAETGPDGLVARDGPGALEGSWDELDPRRVNVVPILLMDTSTYFNASKVVSWDPVGSPTEWAFSHTDDPGLPAEATYTEAERDMMYDATNATLSWLAREALPATGGRFVSNTDLADMVDPGSGISVSQAEIADAANDLLARWTLLKYPSWVGVSWGYCRGEIQYFSLADMYGLLAQALAAYDERGSLPSSVGLVTVNGPREDATPSQPWNRLRLGSVVDEAVRQVDALTDDAWRVDPRSKVPSSSAPGGVDVNAMEFLLLMAEAYMVLYEDTATGDPLLTLYPCHQWPVTQLALDLEGRVTDAGDSWALKPASSNLKQDTVPPTVRYVTPAPGSEDVPLNSNITVTFSERMDETLSLADAVEVLPPVGGEVAWRYHRLVLDPGGDLRDNTTYTVTVKRSLRDAAGNPLAAEVTWTFETVGLENEPPSLLPWPEGRYVEVLENQTVRLGVLAEDDGPPPLRYSWRLDGLLVGGAIGDSFVFTPTYTDAGEHIVTVVVSDAAEPPGTSSFTWNVTVVNVNIPPVILGSEPFAGKVELLERVGTFRFTVQAEDPDEGVLNFEWSLDSEPVSEDYLSEGGSVYQYPLSFESAGEHDLTCRVTDSAGEGSSIEWEVVVEDVNRHPLILAISPDPPPTVHIGESVLIEVNASDPDGDDLLYSWYLDGIPVAATEVGQWTFVPQMEGSFTIGVLVEDGREGTVSTQTAVNVLPEAAVSPDPDPSIWPWIILLIAMALIILVLAWPHLRWLREGGNEL